jgi:hypothetical protein
MDNVNVQRVVIRKQDRINYVLSGVCEFYGITQAELCRKNIRNPQKINQKRIAMKILHDVADLSLKDIGYSMGYDIENPSNIYQQLYIISDQLDECYVGSKKLKIEYNQVLKHLNL